MIHAFLFNGVACNSGSSRGTWKRKCESVSGSFLLQKKKATVALPKLSAEADEDKARSRLFSLLPMLCFCTSLIEWDDWV